MEKPRTEVKESQGKSPEDLAAITMHKKTSLFLRRCSEMFLNGGRYQRILMSGPRECNYSVG